MTAIKTLIVAAFVVCALGCGFAPDVTSRYAVPLEDELQAHIVELSQEAEIDPAVVFAVIEVESRYEVNAMGDSGRAYGLMQVQERWHRERMADLGVTNLLDPYQNVSVGIDYLAECIAHNDGNVEMGLMEYNAGALGARRMWFDHGVYTNHYSQKVLGLVQKIAEGAYADA